MCWNNECDNSNTKCWSNLLDTYNQERFPCILPLDIYLPNGKPLARLIILCSGRVSKSLKVLRLHGHQNWLVVFDQSVNVLPAKGLWYLLKLCHLSLQACVMQLKLAPVLEQRTCMSPKVPLSHQRCILIRGYVVNCMAAPLKSWTLSLYIRARSRWCSYLFHSCYLEAFLTWSIPCLIEHLAAVLLWALSILNCA